MKKISWPALVVLSIFCTHVIQGMNQSDELYPEDFFAAIAGQHNDIFLFKCHWFNGSCNETFSTEQQLQEHVISHVSDYSKVGKPKHACRWDECNTSLKYKQGLERHIISVHLGETIECEQCNKQFSSRRAHQRHLVMMHKENDKSNFVCPQCSQCFSQQCNLTSHINTIHSKVKNYKCTYENCTRAFTKKANLDAHISRHKGEIFTCYLCDKELKTKEGLKKHLARHKKEIKS